MKNKDWRTKVEEQTLKNQDSKTKIQEQRSKTKIKEQRSKSKEQRLKNKEQRTGVTKQAFKKKQQEHHHHHHQQQQEQQQQQPQQPQRQTNKQQTTMRQAGRPTEQTNNKHGWDLPGRREWGQIPPQKTAQAHSPLDLITFTPSANTDGHGGRSRSQAVKLLSQRREGVRVTSTKALWERGLCKLPGIPRLITKRPTASAVQIDPAWDPVRAKLTGLRLPLLLGP